MTEVISTYTRQQAIEDGELVDISDTAEVKEAGFKIPVCLTRAVHKTVEVPEKLKGLQDYKGRLWDLCYMASIRFKTYRKAGNDCKIVPFLCDFQHTERVKKTHKFWLVFNEHEGFTIMYPDDY